MGCQLASERLSAIRRRRAAGRRRTFGRNWRTHRRLCPSGSGCMADLTVLPIWCAAHREGCLRPVGAGPESCVLFGWQTAAGEKLVLPRR